ncbi:MULTISPECIES: hypothetical protein [unclassified Roseovarius]|uniref:hypothetical protein n=1 Tax=unclassified Roseovarius TaxID=2614913 RepID=UPI00273D6F38|nr:MULTISPECIES: hypothetical protein [unclassified Roseovarius]
MQHLKGVLGFIAVVCSSGAAWATPVYLNKDNISVTVGERTAPGTFNNTFNNSQTIEKVIDAPSADAEEFHNQTTHIWFKAAEGGGLELVFDFRISYNITTLHFWNYTGEGYDVDEIEFTFYDAADKVIGMVTVAPATGSSPGIRAEDIPLVSPLNTRWVRAYLTSNNGQIDFQNMGFSAEVADPALDPDGGSGTITLPANGLGR